MATPRAAGLGAVYPYGRPPWTEAKPAAFRQRLCRYVRGSLARCGRMEWCRRARNWERPWRFTHIIRPGAGPQRGCGCRAGFGVMALGFACCGMRGNHHTLPCGPYEASAWVTRWGHPELHHWVVQTLPGRAPTPSCGMQRLSATG